MVYPLFLEINAMSIIILEVLLLITVIVYLGIDSLIGNKIIESKLDLNNKKLDILFEFLKNQLVQIVGKKQLEDKKQSPHLPINRDDIDDDGWRKP